MEARPSKILIILGSTRQHRFSEKAGEWIAGHLARHPGLEAQTVDLRGLDLPLYDEPVSPATVKEGNYNNPAVREWAKTVAAADGYLIIAPEYNHGYPAVLKNALDNVYAEWNNKPAAFVSYGSVGGARSVEQLRLVAVELQMAPIRAGVHIQTPWKLLDQSGNLPQGALASYDEAAEAMLAQFSWWVKALKEARAATQ